MEKEVKEVKEVKPVGNYVIMQMDKAPTMEGLIHLPQYDRFTPNTGTIVGLGTGDDNKSVELPEGVKIGDKVIVMLNTKKKIKISKTDGTWVMAVPPDEIIARIDEE